MDSSIYKKGENIEKYYKICQTLGEGSFAVVKKGIKKHSSQEFAIKIFSKEGLKADDSISLRNEVEILTQLDHPNVVKLFEVYEDDKCIYLVMELMSGGELFDRIVEKDHYTEKEASDAIRPVVDCVKYCHSLGIAHRDLKPENLLYSSKDPTSVIKISDFGLAKFFNQQLMTTGCGTPGYVAPELLTGKGYDHSIDIWAIGVIIYILISGFPPFYSENDKELFEQIKNGKFDYPSPYFDNISSLAKDLINKILVVDPTKRLTADQILNHPWIVGDKTPRNKLPEVTNKIRQFNKTNKFKKAAMATVMSQKIALALSSKKVAK